MRSVLPLLNAAARQRGSAYIVINSVLAGLRFLPVLWSAFAGDDGYLAHVAAVAPVDHVSLFTVYHEMAAHRAAQQPGFFPLAALPWTPWLINAPIQKTIHYLLIVFGFALFSYIARTLLASRVGSTLAVVCTLVAWQLRPIHDPIASTSLVFPVIADLLLGAFCAWLLYERSKRASFLVLAGALLALALMTGPLAWAGAVVLIGTALASKPRTPVRLFCVAAAFAVASSIAFSPAAWPWLHHGGAYGATAFRQLFAGLPATYRAAGNLPIGLHEPAVYHNGTEYTDDRFINIPPVVLAQWIAVFALTACAGFYLHQLRNRPTRPLPRAALVFGLLMSVLPAFLFEPVRFWKNGIALGQAFPTVYLEYFGIGILAAALLIRLEKERRIAEVLPILFALGVFLVAYGNVRTDNVAFARAARIDASRVRLEMIGRAGFFKHLPHHVSMIALDPSLPFARGIHGTISDAKYAIFQYSGRRFTVVSSKHTALRKNTWLLDLHPRNTGFVAVLAHYAHAPREARFDRAYAFTIDDKVAGAVSGVRRGVTGSAHALRFGKGVYVQRRCGGVALDRVFAAARPTLTWGNGFFNQGPPGYTTPKPVLSGWGSIAAYPKIFMAREGTLTIYPSNCPPAPVNVSLQTVSAHKGTLTIYSPNHVDRIMESRVLQTFTLRYVVSDKPIVVRFVADAAPGDLDPEYFRYQRSMPRRLRIVLQPARVWEDVPEATEGTP